MPYQRNYGTNQFPEYQTNAGADSTNGYSGSMAPGAVTNQNVQREKPATRPAADPYVNFKTSAMEWSSPQALSNTLGGAQPQTTGAATQTDPSALSNVLGGGTQFPIDGPPSGGPGVTPPGTPPFVPPSTTSNFLHPGQDTPQPPTTPPNTFPVTPPLTTPPPNPGTPPVIPPVTIVGPPPAGIDMQTWSDANRWVNEAKAKGWDYSYLLQQPQLISQFRAWQQANNAQAVDPVDWLKHNGYSSPGAGRSGDDTFLKWYQSAHAGQPGTPSGPPTTPPVAPPVLPPAPVNPPPPNTAPPPVRQDPTNWKPTTYPGVPDDKTLATILGGYLNPAYQQGQNDLGAQLRGQAALTGDSNSGGFGEVFGRSEGRLIADQNKDFADKLMAARTQEKDLAQQRYNTDVGAQTAHYQIDSNKFTQQLQDDTARYGIKTNSDMERYLADQKTSLAKYGIDVDAIMKQYQADLQLKGQQYGIDKIFDIQVFQDATNRYIADLNRQNQQDSNNLGWGQLGVQRYGIDTNAQIQWADLARQLGLSPQDLANILAGFTPGVAYHPPPGGNP